MRKVDCGSQGLRVSRIGLGCMGMAGSYGEADEAQAVRTLQAALEAEVTFWDTADVYGNGQNEELLSHQLKDRRESLVLASKCGITGRNSDGLVVNGRPDYIYKSCEASLKRLRTDYIDLYYLHRVDPDVPVEESVGALGELVRRGLVRYAGLSEASAESIRRGHGEFPLSAVQSEYSLFSRDVETEILPTLRELGIALVAYSPLGRGALTGTIHQVEELSANDFRRQLPRFEEENLKRNQRLVARIREVARGQGRTTAQIALAWVLQRGHDVIPIPGTKRPKYVFENAESIDITFSAQELEVLDFSSEEISGSRYSAELEKAVGR